MLQGMLLSQNTSQEATVNPINKREYRSWSKSSKTPDIDNQSLLFTTVNPKKKRRYRSFNIYGKAAFVTLKAPPVLTPIIFSISTEDISSKVTGIS